MDRGCRPDISMHLPSAVAEVVTLGWHSDPHRRPSAQQIVDALMTLGGADDDLSRPSSFSEAQFSTTWK